MAAAEECSDERSLKTVFEEGYLLHGQIENDETPSNSDVFQVFPLFVLKTDDQMNPKNVVSCWI